jgi:hypothetical protein
MRRLLAGACALAIVSGSGAASATEAHGTFAGVISSGTARGTFGFTNTTDLTNLPIKGTFRYDTAQLGPDCPDATFFFGCFVSTSGGMTIKETVNHHTVVFAGDNQSGLLLENLVVPSSVNLHADHLTTTLLTDATVSALLPAGTVTDPGNPVVTYSGAASNGFDFTPFEGQDFSINVGFVSEIVGGQVFQNTVYNFNITRFSIAAPEPGTWAMMLAGLAVLGSGLRRRRVAAA